MTEQFSDGGHADDDRQEPVADGQLDEFSEQVRLVAEAFDNDQLPSEEVASGSPQDRPQIEIKPPSRPPSQQYRKFPDFGLGGAAKEEETVPDDQPTATEAHEEVMGRDQPTAAVEHNQVPQGDHEEAQDHGRLRPTEKTDPHVPSYAAEVAMHDYMHDLAANGFMAKGDPSEAYANIWWNMSEYYAQQVKPDVDCLESAANIATLVSMAGRDDMTAGFTDEDFVSLLNQDETVDLGMPEPTLAQQNLASVVKFFDSHLTPEDGGPIEPTPAHMRAYFAGRMADLEGSDTMMRTLLDMEKEAQAELLERNAYDEQHMPPDGGMLLASVVQACEDFGVDPTPWIDQYSASKGAAWRQQTQHFIRMQDSDPDAGQIGLMHQFSKLLPATGEESYSSDFILSAIYQTIAYCPDTIAGKEMIGQLTNRFTDAYNDMPIDDSNYFILASFSSVVAPHVTTDALDGLNALIHRSAEHLINNVPAPEITDIYKRVRSEWEIMYLANSGYSADDILHDVNRIFFDSIDGMAPDYHREAERANSYRQRLIDEAARQLAVHHDFDGVQQLINSLPSSYHKIAELYSAVWDEATSVRDINKLNPRDNPNISRDNVRVTMVLKGLAADFERAKVMASLQPSAGTADTLSAVMAAELYRSVATPDQERWLDAYDFKPNVEQQWHQLDRLNHEVAISGDVDALRVVSRNVVRTFENARHLDTRQLNMWLEPYFKNLARHGNDQDFQYIQEVIANQSSTAMDKLALMSRLALLRKAQQIR